MHRVTEGIVDRSHFLVDLWIMPPNVGHGQRNEFSKGSRSIHAHAQRMRTQVPPSCQAIAAAATDHMPLATHDIAWIEVVDVRAHSDDLPDKFVPDGHRHRNRLLRPGVPLVDMNVGTTDAGISNANQNVVDADGRFSNLFQPEASLRTALYQGFHSILQFELRNPCPSLFRRDEWSDKTRDSSLCFNPSLSLDADSHLIRKPATVPQRFTLPAIGPPVYNYDLSTCHARTMANCAPT